MDTNFKDILFRNEQLKEYKGKKGYDGKVIFEIVEWIISLSAPFIIGIMINLLKWDWSKEHWDNFLESDLFHALGFITFFSKLLFNIFRHFEHKSKTHFEQIFNNKEIVVKIDIDKFDNGHVLVIQEIIEQLQTKESITDLYILDNSHPAQWWSGSMLAYLAVQSSWIKIKNNKLHRIFVFNNSELESEEARKIVAFHVLMGFNTYILEKNTYMVLVKEYNNLKTKTNDNVLNKEFFVWNNSDELKNRDENGNPYYSCDIKSIPKIYEQGDKIIGYHSLWSMDIPYHQRKDGNPFNRIDGSPIDLGKWPVKFEFLLSQNENERKAYVEFAKYLIEKSKGCKISSEISKHDEIIQILPKNKDGTQIEVNKIYGIINSFNNKLS